MLSSHNPTGVQGSLHNTTPSGKEPAALTHALTPPLPQAPAQEQTG